MLEKQDTTLPKMTHMKLFWIVIGIMLLASAALAADDGRHEQKCTREGDWKKIFTRQGITVYSQRLPGSNLLAFRADAVLNASLGQMMEVLRRVEITDEWMPDIREKYILQDNSDKDVITYSLNRVPFPFLDRELVLRNSVRLDRGRKYIVLDMYSISYDILPVKKGTVRAEMRCGEMRVRPISDRKTEIDLLLYVDPRGFIPFWLVNMFQKKLPYNFLKELEKKAATTNFEVRPEFQQLIKGLKAVLNQSGDTDHPEAPM